MKTTLATLSSLVVVLTGLLSTNLTPAHAAVYLWNAAGPGINNWNDSANWTPATGSPGAGDTAIFGAAGTSPDAVSINNVVSVNTAITSLSYTNTGTGLWHVTEIPANVTLSVSGATIIGGQTSTSIANLGTFVAMTDGGTLSLNGNLTMGDAGTGLSSSTVDFSGLGNFVFNAISGTIAVGNATHSMVTWKLASLSNNITAGTINDNTPNASNSGTGNLTLGAGTNIFNVGTFNIAAGRATSTLAFPASSTEGGLRIRGTNGTDASFANMTLGNHNTGGSGSTSAGNLSVNGYPVDLRLGTLTLGQSSSAPTGNSFGNGTVSFDTGRIVANTIVMAVSSGTTAFAQANGTINVGGTGQLTVGSGGISMANQGAASGPATGKLNLTGGTVICSNSISKANASGSGIITVSGGSLNMVGGVIGTAAIPIDELNIGDSTLSLAISANMTNVFVTMLTTTSSTNNTINISALPVILAYPAQYPIIRYTSYSPVFDPDFLVGSTPAGSPAYVGYISNNVANSTLDLVITNGPAVAQVLTWNGNVNGNWDTSTANWQGSKTYSQNDYVLFDDTASGTTNVNLTTTLTPGNLTISNSTKNYVFNGAGNIGGGIALNKSGAGTLTIANSGINTYSNGVSIQGGTVQLSGSADRLPTGSIVTLADVAGAMLDLNNFNQTVRSLNGGGLNGGNVTLGSATLTDWSGGTFGGVISGSGQLIKTNLPGTSGGTLVLTNASTYSGGTIIGGYTNNTTLAVANQTGSGTGPGFVRVLTNGSLYIGNGGPGGSVAAGVITNDGTVRLNRSDDFAFTNIIVGAGVLQIQNTNTVSVTGANGYSGGTAINQGYLRVSNPGALGSGTITIGNGAPAALQLTNGIALSNPLSIGSKPGASGVIPHVENLSGSNSLSGPLQLTANGGNGWLFYATAGRLLISSTNTVLNSTQTSQTASRPLWLRGDGDGEWSGNINDTINSITNLAVRKDGLGTWILSGVNNYSGSTVISNGTLLVNGSLGTNSSVTVAGGTLGGNGLIGGPVTLSAGGILAPGTSVGTLTISNSLALNGTTIMEVAHSGSDKVVGIGSLTLGGTLQIVVNGTLTGGEVFKLFAATSYSGDFVTYDLPGLPGSLGWDSSSVPVDGILKVTGGLPTLAFTQSGNVLTFTWSGSYKLQSQTNSLNAGLKPNNWFDYPGGTSSGATATINPANPTVFFRLITQ